MCCCSTIGRLLEIGWAQLYQDPLLEHASPMSTPGLVVTVAGLLAGRSSQAAVRLRGVPHARRPGTRSPSGAGGSAGTDGGAND